MPCSIHLFDASRPDDDENVYPVQCYSDVIPRVGDHIDFHVDWHGYTFSAGEPMSVEGCVAKVEIEYRRMSSFTAVLVSAWLSDYKATLPQTSQDDE